ncbi:putative ribonuclease H-like domain-containing protein [Tanacetum coccineum]
MPALEDVSIFDSLRDDEDDGAEADMNNLDTTIQVSPILTTRIHKDHPLEQVIRDLQSATQTRRMSKNLEEHGFDPSWIEAMQEEILQFKLQEVWTLVDLPNGKGAIGTKWVFRNKKDERGIVIKKTKKDWLLKDYVDDIIFGSTKKELCLEFKKLIHEKFQMSSMGELTFFLGLQVKQKKDGIFISQDKYVDDILQKLVCACARYQVNPKVSHLHVVKRIFRYLKGQPKLGLWYLKDSPFDLVAYTNSDYAGASLDRKSTTGGCQFLGCRLISWQCKKHTVVANSTTEAEYVAASSNVAVYKELDNSLVRVATTTSSLEAEQGSGGPRCQETMGDTIAQTRFENISKLFNDLLLARVLDLEKTKTTQAEEIVSLKRRVKKLEQKKRSRTHRLKRIYRYWLREKYITLVNDQDDADMFDVNTLTGDEVLAEQEVADKDVNLTIDEVTLAQALAALKSVKPKVKTNVVEEPSVPVSAASTKVSAATTTTTATIPTSRKGIVITELCTSTTTTKISLRRSKAKLQDKGKGILVEEPLKPKKKDLIRLDEEIASKLQGEFDEEERLAREKDESNVALTEEWDDIQAKVDVDYQLAQRLQAEEQEQFITEQKATLFKELLEQRRKHFAAKRAEEKRNNPPTQAQQRKIMAFKRVNTFVDFRTDLVEVSSKRAGDELKQEVTKKQKVDDIQETTKVDNDQETSKIKEFM